MAKGRVRKRAAGAGTAATVRFEAQLWQAADALRRIDGKVEHGDTFHNDRVPDLKASYILANPPFNVSDWGGERLREDKRWKYGVPPAGNANFAWVQHVIHHLAPSGMAGFVLANGSMSSGAATLIGAMESSCYARTKRSV